MTPIGCDRHDTVRGMWRMWAWLVLLSVALYFLVRLLLSVGTQEPDLVDVLSLVFAILGIFISVYQVRRDRSGGDGESAKPWPRRKLIAVGVVVVLALVAVGVDWVIRENRDLDVTGEITMSSNQPLAHGEVILLAVPGNPPARDNLILTLDLSNVDRTGNCVDRAKLELRPHLDDKGTGKVEALPGKAATVPLGEANHKAVIAVTVIQPSSERQSACKVRLNISRAILQN